MSFTLSRLSRQVGFALGIACAWSAQAADFSNLYVFGDSLSDTGNNGRYTFNSSQNPLYDEILAGRYGLTLAPSDAGGNNYAAGSAVAIPAINPQDNTQEQVQRYLARVNGLADGEGLYIHWVGGNDLAAAALNPLQAATVARTSAQAAATQVRTLLNAGAGTVIVPTVPDVSATPTMMESVIVLGLAPVAASALQAAYASLNSVQTPGLSARQQAIHQALYAAASAASPIPAVQQAIGAQLVTAYDTLAGQVSQLTTLYNMAEEQSLAQQGGNIVRADINGIFNEILANPAPFGITNTAGMACPPGLSAADCTSQSPGFNASQAWLFADHLHPSPAVHALIADYIQSIIAAPAQVSTLNKGTLAAVQDSRATLDSRYNQLRNGPKETGSVGVFGGYSGQYRKYSDNAAGRDGRANTNNLTVGVDYQLTENWLVGGLIAGSLDKHYPTDNFQYDADAFQVGLFSALEYGPAWLSADVHYLTADYNDIQRQVELGPLTRTEKGDTSATLWGARLTAGFDIPVTPEITTGPTLQYAWDYSHVDGYREQGDDSTAMRYRDQNYHSQVGSAGWRIDGRFGVVKPWAEVNYRHQFGDNVWMGQGGLKNTALTFSRDGVKEDTNWVDTTIGASLPLSEQVSAFAAVSQTGGLSSGEQTRYNLGISASF
ncbi:autotransporter outer membrane beta-barrel domain-containing protein [Franconibacter daqui]|uniref:autotransporter outer membrane beta-barrel domain-containing protein n=1 Tax=Franconibacter daqui TaxID=2047724 RepID=UPI002DB6E1E9|nr:autotransporter domain-containing protein [Franconibacter daqui]MEB5920430.1 autotransporter domain-containing protein [Franconibacter daqui]